MRNLAVFSTLMLLVGCQPKLVDAQFEELKAGETKFLLTIDNDAFYEEDAVFEGHLEAKENYFVMNFVNQHAGNFILTFSGIEKWYDQKPVEGQLYGTAASNLMIGKVVDKKENKGVGYLMSEGNITALTVSKEKLVFKVEGKLKKYPNVREEDPSFNFDGYIISKSPTFNDYSIPNR
jgi:hypothetical protein